MIVRPRPHWFRMLFVWHGSVLRRILPQLLVIAALAIAVAGFHGRVYHFKVTLNPVPFSLVGITLAIFLGFRNSASYDRYWEARKLWGALLNDARSLARQALTLPAPDFNSRRFVLGIAAFTHLLRNQLRKTAPEQRVAELLPEAVRGRVTGARYRPAMMLLVLGEWLREARTGQQLDPMLAQAMEPGLNRLSDVLGGCERIAGTPLPFTYSVIIHRTVYIYCLLLPFGLVDSLGPMAAVMAIFIAYTFLSLEALGDEIEEPFGLLPNDLALDAMSVNIETTLREMLGDREFPAAPAVTHYRLS